MNSTRPSTGSQCKFLRKGVISAGKYTLDEKFEEEAKRNTITEYLKNPKPDLKNLIYLKENLIFSGFLRYTFP